MKQLLPLLGLFAAAAFAQEPVVGPEVISDPIGASVRISDAAAPAVRVVPDRGGFVLAWSALAADEHVHVYVGRLDASLHLVPGSVRVMPYGIGADADAEAINVIAHQDGYVASWVEHQRSDSSLTPGFGLAAAWLDASLNPAPPRLLQSFGALPPRVALWNGRVAIASGTTLYTVDRNATAIDAFNVGGPADDLAVAGGEVFVSTHVSTRTPSLCLICRGGPFPPVDTYDMTLLWLFHSVIKAPTQRHLSSYATALAADGRGVLTAWFDATAENGGVLYASFFALPAIDEPFQLPVGIADVHRDLAAPVARQPQVATDGNRYVVVWQDRTERQRDILGAVVYPEEKRVVPFTIAATEADETEPSIVAAGSGIFVVAYNSTTGGSARRIAGRFVTFPPARPRTVR